jgi:hypothetical protein
MWGKGESSGSEITESPKLKLKCNEDTVVPIINSATFSKLLNRLVEATSQLPIFVPAVGHLLEGSSSKSDTLSIVLAKLDMKLNSLEASRTEWHASCGDDVNELSSDTSLLWGCSLPFSSVTAQYNTSSESLETGVELAWQEYLTYNDLTPLSVLVTGPPRSGKSEIAQALAAK